MNEREPFSETFKLGKDATNGVRYAEGLVFNRNQLPAAGHAIRFHRPPPSHQCRRMSDNHRYHHIRNKPIRVRKR